MKPLSWTFIFLAIFGSVLTGCGKAKVDTSKLDKSFQSASGTAKTDVSTAIAAITAGDFAKAVPILEKVVKAGGLTDEQKDGVSTAVMGMQTVVAQNPNKYSVELYNSLSDLAAFAEGRQPITRPP